MKGGETNFSALTSQMSLGEARLMEDTILGSQRVIQVEITQLSRALKTTPMLQIDMCGALAGPRRRC